MNLHQVSDESDCINRSPMSLQIFWAGNISLQQMIFRLNSDIG
jgi:hypothetical protein